MLARDGTQRGDGSLEAGVDGLEAIARRAAEEDPDVPLELVLRHHHFLDAVTVKVDGDRHGLEVDELGPRRPARRARLEQLEPQVAPAADGARRSPRILGTHRDAQPLVFVDEHEGARVLASDAGQRCARCSERTWHAHRSVAHELVTLEGDPMCLALTEKRLSAEPLRPDRLLRAATVRIDGPQNVVAVL